MSPAESALIIIPYPDAPMLTCSETIGRRGNTGAPTKLMQAAYKLSVRKKVDLKTIDDPRLTSLIMECIFLDCFACLAVLIWTNVIHSTDEKKESPSNRKHASMPKRCMITPPTAVEITLITLFNPLSKPFAFNSLDFGMISGRMAYSAR